MTDRAQLVPLIGALAKARVLCVGDVMLDYFNYGSVDRISPEAPIPVLKVEREDAMLGGAGNVLAHALEHRLESEVRTTILGHVQRGGTPTPFDRVLSTHFGSQAACVVEEGRSGVMVALHDGRMTEIPLTDVAGKVRNVKPNDPHVRAALSVGTSFGVREL